MGWVNDRKVDLVATEAWVAKARLDGIETQAWRNMLGLSRVAAMVDVDDGGGREMFRLVAGVEQSGDG